METFMRKILLATAAFAFSAGMAMAADDADIEINASLDEDCQITDSSASLTHGAVDEYVPGVFTYECNFIGAPQFTFDSANDGVMTTENGGATVDYGIYLNDIPAFGTPSTFWLKASDTPAGYGPGGPGPVISTTVSPNVSVSPSFAVALIEPLTVAGEYSDLLTITIAP